MILTRRRHPALATTAVGILATVAVAVATLAPVSPAYAATTVTVPVTFDLPMPSGNAGVQATLYDLTGEFVPGAVDYELTTTNLELVISGVQPGEYYVGVRTSFTGSSVGWAEEFLGGGYFMDESATIVVGAEPVTTPTFSVGQAAEIDVNVQVTVDDSDRSDLELWFWSTTSSTYRLLREVETDEMGYFDFTHLPPGQYLMHVESRALMVQSEWWLDVVDREDATPIVITAGQTLDLVPYLGDYRTWETDRLGGADRYAANVSMSRSTFPPAEGPYSIDVLYVASGEKYPDALSAGPAAIAQNGGLLLVTRDSIPATVRAEIVRLNPQRIVVVGGPLSVSAAVYAELGQLADEIERISGADRYDVSRNLIESAFGGCGNPTCLESVFVATGSNFPDALAAGPAAGHLGGAVLLVNGSSADLDGATAMLLDELGVQDAYIVGGTASVTPGIESALNAAVPGTVTRYSGVDRYDAAANINDAVFEATDTVLIAAGGGFADALAGGPLAGSLGAPLYLSPQGCLTYPAYVSIHSREPSRIVLLGGPNSIAESVVYNYC